MAYIGDFTIGATLDFKFSTVGTTGAPTTLAGTPVISAYVGNSTTQLTAGITLTVDFDGVTGLHNVRVVASVGNGYAAATDVDLVITTGTVGGTSVVGYVVGSFSIDNRSTAAIKSDTAAILIDTAEIGVAGAGLTALASATNLATVAGYLDTEIAAIKAKTDNLPAAPAATGDIPTAVENADALLGRNVSGGSSTGRTVKQAFHFVRNKWVVAAGTLTVYDTDDSSTSWTATVTGTPGADPVTSMDP